MKSEHMTDRKPNTDRSSYSYAISGRTAELGAFASESFEIPRQRKSSRLAWLISETFVGPFFLLVTLGYTYLVPQALSDSVAAQDTYRRMFKRIVDIIASAIGLVLAVPLFIIFPILIKLNSRGPVFYTQVRVGQDRRRQVRRAYNVTDFSDGRRRERRREDFKGRLFKIMKFRTMIHNAEKGTGPVWATKNDPRITGFGAFLRACRLDELQQLWSVFTGQMSLVGPRPERPAFVRDLETRVPGYHRRLTVKPGLTGLAQVENGYDDSVFSVTEKIKTDLRYIDTWTAGLDIRILLRTVWVVLSGRGAK